MKNKKHFIKKGQMKIQQMAFMLIVVTLFFVLVGMLILSVAFSGLKSSAEDLRKEKARTIVTSLANSPELSCGEYFGSAKVDCIDMDKFIILKQEMQKYRNFWGSEIQNVELVVLYPQSEEKLCTLGNYPNCNDLKLMNYPTGVSEENYVLACRNENLAEEVYSKCEIAKLLVTYEEVK